MKHSRQHTGNGAPRREAPEHEAPQRDTPATERAPEQLSTPELISAIASKATVLVREEVELARSELTSDVAAELAAAKRLGVAALAGITTLNLLCVAAVFALTRYVAGWIAAGASLAKRRDHPHDPPHLILLPEIPFNQEKVLEDIRRVLKREKFCLIVVAEGLVDSDGNYLAAEGVKDSFGHAQLGGAGDALADIIGTNIPGTMFASRSPACSSAVARTPLPRPTPTRLTSPVRPPCRLPSTASPTSWLRWFVVRPITTPVKPAWPRCPRSPTT
jgi:hypothetical protein